jgi:hypothetical protein
MWWKPNLDVLVKFIEARGIADEQARTVLAIALLAQRDENSDHKLDEEPLYRLLDRLDATTPTLDTPLLLRVLETAHPAQIASVLFNPIGLHFSVAQFQRFYQRVPDSSPSDFTLYELVAGTVDFLRRHPGTISIPPEIIARLMESPHSDSRIVAMKALSHSPVSLEYYADCLLRCLESGDDLDKCIGLFQLGQLIDQNGRRCLESLDPERT